MKTGYNPKTMIKSKFSNQVHEIIQPENGKGNYLTKWWKRKQRIEKMSDKEKLEMLNKILSVYEECSKELTNYLNDRRNKKKVQKLREAKNNTRNEIQR